MLETVAIHQLHNYMTFANDCISLSYVDQIKKIESEDRPEMTEYNAIVNMKYFCI